MTERKYKAMLKKINDVIYFLEINEWNIRGTLVEVGGALEKKGRSHTSSDN